MCSLKFSFNQLMKDKCGLGTPLAVKKETQNINLSYFYLLYLVQIGNESNILVARTYCYLHCSFTNILHSALKCIQQGVIRVL